MLGVDREALVEMWRKLVGPGKCWVLFEHGTCVVVRDQAGSPVERASEILGEFGPVQVGTPAGDFQVLALRDDMGWVVLGEHPDVLNYVAPDELNQAGDVIVGVLGRDKRHEDGGSLRVVHVEDNRAGG
jgi:hypothetical protein